MALQLAVSSVILALRPAPDDGPLTLWLPLVRRIREPYEGSWALPGGPLGEACGLEQAARDALSSTTGLDPAYLEQLYAFGGLDRSLAGGAGGAGGDDGADQADRVVSIVYWALVQAEEDQAAVRAHNVEWFPASALPDLAFDHTQVIDYALARLRAKIGYSPIAHAFLPAEFTLAELRAVHEAVLGRELDPANFRRQALATGAVEPTGHRLQGTRHRPPSLYRYRAESVATSPTPPPRSAS
ncbi:NUDIX hydrolase [Litorihabitans aurantiacus]|uniref:ADP-ribose pyrophosphatase n=1 Tax=Litorihabitans aurantiacus TaxID=1930061 RepID=A0AA38CT13_9MICO|nr:NUDIX hydrolase [Litorihabitans aurantiacus]GMA32019.1 ADP-ribose pyrophosphatase [Litorihabitans aurantiacus]